MQTTFKVGDIVGAIQPTKRQLKSYPTFFKTRATMVGIVMPLKASCLGGTRVRWFGQGGTYNLITILLRKLA